MESERSGRVAITYCTQCNWGLRASWFASELLSTFALEIDQVVLVPRTGGVFTITADGQPIWDRKTDGGFPEISELKRRVRDAIAPDKPLGHIDRAASERHQPADVD